MACRKMKTIFGQYVPNKHFIYLIGIYQLIVNIQISFILNICIFIPTMIR